MTKATTSRADRDRQHCREVCEKSGIPETTIEAAWAGEGSNSGRNNVEVTTCLRVLFAGGLAVSAISRGMGLNAPYRLAKLGLTASGRAQPSADLPGERWRKVPGVACEVSDRGRVRGASGTVLKLVPCSAGRLRVNIWANSSREMWTVANLVVAAFVSRRRPHQKERIEYKNNDPTDLRPANLFQIERAVTSKGGLRRTRRTRKDKPWTKAEDHVLRKVRSINEAYRSVDHERAYVRQRLKRLGISLEKMHSGALLPPLERRNLDEVKTAVSVLEASGMGDRAVNVALGITVVSTTSPELAPARGEAIRLLWRKRYTRKRLCAVFGFTPTTVARWLYRLGLVEPGPAGGGKSTLGPPEPIAGERWADVPGTAARVSDLGRVVGTYGELLSPKMRPTGSLSVQVPAIKGRRSTTRRVGAMVLAAFKPDLPYYAAVFVNGDRADCRAENMIPRAEVGKAAQTKDPAVLFAQAQKMVPQYRQTVDGREVIDARRDDIIAEMVLMVMDGRAVSLAKAYPLAKQPHTAHSFKERSLNVSRPGDREAQIDRLAADQEAAGSRRKSAERPCY